MLSNNQPHTHHGTQHPRFASFCFFKLEENCFMMLCWFLPCCCCQVDSVVSDPIDSSPPASGFCHTTPQISHGYIHHLPLEPPSPPPVHPSRYQSARMSSLCYIATLHQLSILYMVVYIGQCYLLPLSHSHWEVCFSLTLIITNRGRCGELGTGLYTSQK